MANAVVTSDSATSARENDAIEVVESGDGGGGSVAFTFGEPEPVLDGGRAVWGYFAAFDNGRWYEPPFSFDGLDKSLHAMPHHGSCIRMKVNMLKRFFRPSAWLSAAEFEKLALDLLVFGCAFPERIDNMANRPMQVRRTPALYTRRGKEDGQFWFLPRGRIVGVEQFEPGTVTQLMIPDTRQEVYGVPEYLGALQALWLNEAATLFRRKYYANGSHAGYILYVSEEGFSQADREALGEAMKQSKGPGNFRNLLLHIPKGKKDGVQILPISEVMAKDEFVNIKNISRDDVLAAHRVPPQLLGMVPVNAGGFGSAPQAAQVFFEQEIIPLQTRLMEINEWIGQRVVQFDDYVPPVTVGGGVASG